MNNNHRRSFVIFFISFILMLAPTAVSASAGDANFTAQPDGDPEPSVSGPVVSSTVHRKDDLSGSIAPLDSNSRPIEAELMDEVPDFAGIYVGSVAERSENAPSSTTEACAQLLVNTELNVVGDSITPWVIIDDIVYFSDTDFVSPQHSLLFRDNDIGDSSPTQDSFGQLFTTPSNLTEVTIEYSTASLDSNIGDEAFGSLWTVDAGGNLDQFVEGWEVGESDAVWQTQTVIFTDAAALQLLEGEDVAILLYNETSASTPDEVVFFDDITFTACYDDLGHISGNVTDGVNPLPNIDVSALRWTDNGYDWERYTYTDEAGNYDLGDLPDGTYRILFDDPSGFYSYEYYDDVQTLESATDVVITGGSTVSGIDAVLFELGHITGAVTDGANPLANIEVTAYRWTGSEYHYARRTSTDASGNYDVSRLTSGTYRLRFSDSTDSYISEYYDDAPDLNSATDIAVSTGSTTSGIDVILAGYGHISGSVSDGTNPLPNVQVTAYYWTGSGYNWTSSADTDSAGSYVINGLTTGIYRVRFYISDGIHLSEYYDDAPDLNNATDIGVTLGATTAGIDAILAEGGHITGTVTNGTTPLQDIQVVVYSWNGRNYTWRDSTYTSASGSYALSGMPTGNYRVGFFDDAQIYLTEYYDDAPDLDSAVDIAVAAESTTSGIDAILTERGHISGSISDGVAPLPNIEVTAYYWSGSYYNTTQSVYSDAAGNFYLDRLTPGTYRVRFRDNSNVYFTEYYDDAEILDSATDITVAAGATTAGIDAILVEGGQISGSVTDGTDPLSDVELVAYRWTGSEYQWTRSANTDGSGSYHIHGLPAGTYRVKFSHNNYVAEYYDDSPSLFNATDITVTLGATTTGIDAVLTSLGNISGTVSDGANPLSGFEVTAYRWNDGYWGNSGYDYTDASGYYDIGQLTPGIYRVRFSVPWQSDYLIEWYDDAPNRDSATDIIVTPGSTTSGVDAVLALGGQITGDVTDGVDPLANISVEAYYWTGSGSDWSRSTNTDSAGNYEFAGLPTGTYRVRFYDYNGVYGPEYYDDASNLATATDITVNDGSTTSGIDAVLTEWGRISGAVSDGINQLPGVEVTAYRWTGSGFSHLNSTYTDASGNYEITGLPAGTYRVRFSDYDYVTEYYDDAPDLNSATDITVALTATTSGIDAVLTELGHITGTVTDGTNPLQDIYVTFYRWTGTYYSHMGTTWTDAAGTYDKSNLQEGNYRVQFSDSNDDYTPEFYDDAPDLYSATDVTVAASSTISGIDAILTERGRISGTVTDGLRPLPAVRVVVYRWTGSNYTWSRSTNTDSAGEYILGGLVEGTYRVEFSGSDYLTEFYDDAADLEGAADVIVTDETTTSGIDAVLSEGGHITGIVTNGANPISNIRVIAHYWNGSAYENINSTSTDSSGRYYLNGLPTGTYRVEFDDNYRVYPGEFFDDSPDLRNASDITVTAGQTTPNIDAVLIGRGYITIEKQTEPAGADTFIFTGDLGSFSLVAGENKLFAQISEGDYTVSEQDATGWYLSGVSCDSDHITQISDGVTIHLEAGDDIICTFTNRRFWVRADAGGPYTGAEGAPISLDAGSSTHKEMIQSYLWDCTDDGSWDISAASPQGSSCIYPDNGAFTLRMRTVDIFGRTNTDSSRLTVTNVAPDVNAGADQTVMAGREMRFSGAYVDPGTADSHTVKWEFGDGSTKWGTLAPEHVYTGTGRYTVTLTVTDDDGGKGSSTLMVDVVNSAPTMSNIEVNPAAIDEGQRIFLSGNITDTNKGSSLSLLVDWGDGQTETKQFEPETMTFSLAHTYLDDPPGDGTGETYTINLMLTDDEGAFSTNTAVITANNLPPVVDAGPDKIANQGVPFAFSASVADPGLLDTHTFTWDFGDGSPLASGVEITHSFATPGDFTVTVIVEDDDGGIGQDTLNVVVNEMFHFYAPMLCSP